MDPQCIDVQVNGEARRVPPGQSVTALLTWLEVPFERVAVELNRAIVRRDLWDSMLVESGAEIEIVMFVGGG